MTDELLSNEIILQDIENSGDNSNEVSQSEEENPSINLLSSGSDYITCELSENTLNYFNNQFSIVNNSLFIVLAFLLASILFIFFHFAFVNNTDLK